MSHLSGIPYFSIIIPMYNASAYLEDCLTSIARQTFQDWEAIIVDDCSTDCSVDMVRDYARKDSRIKLFLSEVNSKGAYSPRMRAATLANSDRLVIIDADDKVSEDLLSLHYKKIKETSADLVIPEMWRLTESGTYKILPSESVDESQVWIGRNLVEHTLCKWEIPMAGFSVRRDLYLEADNKLSSVEKKSIFADELLSRWILFLSDKVAFDGGHYYYRYNAESVTHLNVPNIIRSRLATCDGLISMTSVAFGSMSPVNLKALDNKFLSAVDALRLINTSKLSASQKKDSLSLIRSAMSDFDKKALKGRISPRYRALMRLPLSLAGYSLRIIDYLLRILKPRPKDKRRT